MGINKTGWDNKHLYDMGTGLANVWLVFSCLILIIYLLVPLFGGKFLPTAFAKYGSWIGNALIAKYAMRYARNKVRMKKQKWFLISFWLMLSIFVWFPNYIGLIICLLLALLLIGTYRSQGHAGWQEEQS